MRFTLMVTGPAYGTQQASSAYLFSQALLAAKHTITSIFFYREGVHNGNLLTSPATDEIDLVRAWQNLHKYYGVKLHICISAALRRGIINTDEAKYTGSAITNLEDGFVLIGLGVLVEAILMSDRVMQF